MEAKLYTQNGKEKGTIALPEEIFGVAWNADLVHQVVTGINANARAGTADTKGRGEVRGGGKKPWKQKGTGRARHGSSRSPIWKGGGVTHGPLAEKNYKQKINKKMKTKALYMVLSKKFKSGQLLFVDSLAMKTIKTKDAETSLKGFAQVKGFERLGGTRKTATLALPVRNEVTEKSFRNLPQISLIQVKDINPVDMLQYRYIIIAEPEKTFEILMKRLVSKVK